MPDRAGHNYANPLAFRPACPRGDASLLIAFGRDLYRESLGSDAEFRRDYGAYGEKFPLWIAACVAADPGFATLLTENDKAIGLVVLGMSRRKALGHVHHFYIVPERRGCGFGGLLDDYARCTLGRAGASRARLNVTPGNARAIRFYLAQGWQKTPRAASRLITMEVAL
jgi:GNAT superfamily N-acetyltransferase